MPLGVVIMALGLRRTRWWPLTQAWENVFLFGVVAFAIAISPIIGRYYRRTFGNVMDDPEAHQRRETMKWFFVYPLMIASLVIDLIFKPAFFITGIVWSGGILAYWSSTGRGRPHYLFASFCMLLLTPLPWLSLVELGRPMFSVFAFMLGAIYIVGGTLDHRELCRVLRPLKEI